MVAANYSLLRSLWLPILVVVLFFLCFASSDFATDRAECGDQIVGLATCLTYVQGSGKAPTPECCTDFKKVVSKSFKCLCVLIKDRNQPELGIKINVTRALFLPSSCGTPVNVSNCPRLLKLPTHSPEAEVFKQFGSAIQDSLKGSNGRENSTVSGNFGSSNKNGSRSTKRWLGVEMGSTGVWIWFFLLLPLNVACLVLS